MLMNSIKFNLKIMSKQITFRFIFAMMLIICVGMPVYYVIKFWGFYAYELPSADTLYIGNSAGMCWQYLALLFPFIIIFPYSTAFLRENKWGVNMYVQVRGERKHYYIAQVITCFIGTFLIFFLPFLLNILLNALLFPMNGNDYVSTYNAYDRNWVDMTMGYGFYKMTLFQGVIFKKIAVCEPQLYNLIYAVWTSFAAGVMAMFTYAVSIVLHKKTLYIFIVNYLFFTSFSIVDRIVEAKSRVYINTTLTDYLSNGLFNHGLVYLFYLLFLFGELICSFLIIRNRLQDDEV